MKSIINVLALCGLCVIFMATLPAAGVDVGTKKIICAGDAISEIVCALGCSDQIVARDSTSLYPPSLLSKPVVGYVRALPSEGILAMAADMLLASDAAGPPVVIQQIKDAGVPVYQFKIDYTVAGVAQRIKAIGAVLGKEQEAAALAQSISVQLNALVNDSDYADRAESEKMNALYVLHPRGGTALVGGDSTSADALLKLSGLNNAAHGLNGWKPISTEAIVEANPELILIGENEFKEIGGIDGLRKLPGLAMTEACKRNNILVIDHGEMLSFGPRLVDAIKKVREAMHAAMAKQE